MNHPEISGSWWSANFKFHFMKLFIRFLLFTFLVVAAFSCEQGPEIPEETAADERRSPIVISAINHDDTYIKVVYGQPYKRGRDIFGGLEPYGEVWRTGANEATEITFTSDIEMDGHPIEAGTYALFTIPEPDVWTVILNTDLGQWGAFTYNPEFDYLRFQVEPGPTEEITEALTIIFEEAENDSTSLSIAWDTTRVDIPIYFP